MAVGMRVALAGSRLGLRSVFYRLEHGVGSAFAAEGRCSRPAAVAHAGIAGVDVISAAAED